MGWSFDIGNGKQINKKQAQILMRRGGILHGHIQAVRALMRRGLAEYHGPMLVRTERGREVTKELRRVLS